MEIEGRKTELGGGGQEFSNQGEGCLQNDDLCSYEGSILRSSNF